MSDIDNINETGVPDTIEPPKRERREQLLSQETTALVAGYKDNSKLEKPRSNLTDVGNAERFAKSHGRNLRYCHLWGRWLMWKSTKWTVDSTDQIMRSAKRTIQNIYSEAGRMEDRDWRETLVKWGIYSEHEFRLRAMIRLTQSELPIAPEELDRDPWLLNCLNGTIELSTGELREHRRKDLIAKLAPVEFDPNAKCPTWQDFLRRIMDDNSELIHYLQRVVGYSLTGDTREQALFILFGTGANGKSTFLNTICEMLGDYAMHTPTQTLLAKQQGSVSNDVARLKGARFVSAVETEEGGRLAESTVKQLTGGDRIVARFLHQEFFEFYPQFKIFLSANHKPAIRGTDNAIWRRIRLIPFEATIPKEEQDLTLAQKLKEELPGVLAWAVRGCLEWQKEGLGMPGTVEKATESYRSEMDVISEFLTERCTVGEDKKVAVARLYSGYTNWCEENGERALSKNEFGSRLKERDFEPGRGAKGVRLWKGLDLEDPFG